MLKTGDQYIHKFRFSQAEVEAFAKVTGDNNPLHLNADYAANTIFKKPIMHGFLGGSIFSRCWERFFRERELSILNKQWSF
jgi:acyl dehydratase